MLLHRKYTDNLITNKSTYTVPKYCNCWTKWETYATFDQKPQENPNTKQKLGGFLVLQCHYKKV